MSGEEVVPSSAFVEGGGNVWAFYFPLYFFLKQITGKAV
jgi:hypothetical protein